jgi:rhodanese-related sulfurtransferase
MNTRLRLLGAASFLPGLVLAANFGCAGAGQNSGNGPIVQGALCGPKEALSAEDQAIVEEVRASGINVMTAAELKAELASEKPPVVVDVLSAESYAAGHIKGSISAPSDRMQEVAARRLPDKSARIVVYCASFECGASTSAAAALQKLGYTNVYDFKGGLKQWRELGGPMEGSKVGR